MGHYNLFCNVFIFQCLHVAVIKLIVSIILIYFLNELNGLLDLHISEQPLQAIWELIEDKSC